MFDYFYQKQTKQQRILSFRSHPDLKQIILQPHGIMVKASAPRARGLGFNSWNWSCVKALGKPWIPHCLGLPSHDGYLVERGKKCVIGYMLLKSTHIVTERWDRSWMSQFLCRGRYLLGYLNYKHLTFTCPFMFLITNTPAVCPAFRTLSQKHSEKVLTTGFHVKKLFRKGICEYDKKTSCLVNKSEDVTSKPISYLVSIDRNRCKK